jgi:uncharacterized Zn-finger protein
MKERRILGVTLVLLPFHKKMDGTHMVSVHEEKKPFECTICDASFAYKHHMNRHIVSVHEEKKPFECNISDARFARKTHLNGHIATVHDGNVKFAM